MADTRKQEQLRDRGGPGQGDGGAGRTDPPGDGVATEPQVRPSPSSRATVRERIAYLRQEQEKAHPRPSNASTPAAS